MATQNLNRYREEEWAVKSLSLESGLDVLLHLTLRIRFVDPPRDQRKWLLWQTLVQPAYRRMVLRKLILYSSLLVEVSCQCVLL